MSVAVNMNPNKLVIVKSDFQDKVMMITASTVTKPVRRSREPPLGHVDAMNPSGQRDRDQLSCQKSDRGYPGQNRGDKIPQKVPYRVPQKGRLAGRGLQQAATEEAQAVTKGQEVITKRSTRSHSGSTRRRSRTETAIKRSSHGAGAMMGRESAIKLRGAIAACFVCRVCSPALVEDQMLCLGVW